MTKNQKTVFWPMLICFYIGATSSLEPQGAFDNLDMVGILFWVFIYLLVSYFIYRFVMKNPKTIDKWCGE